MTDAQQPLRTIDPAALQKHFEAEAVEARWRDAWEAQGTYRYDPSRPREETFVVDTPPPTVSGSLHVGHVFSYTHTDVIVRYQRMRGRNIFYPMGWDDNGLPTERRVQNYFHVRVDVRAPYEADLAIESASDEKVKKEQPRLISRPNFIELCQRVTHEDEKAFKHLWSRLGLSVDWRQQYATIDPHCRRLAQRSFIDLFNKGHVYSVFAPTMWDVEFHTAVAQAELEERPHRGAFHDIAFGVEGSDDHFVISTTRPELLPACVGVAAHPDDPRYQGLLGKRARTPLFRVPVVIFASRLVDPTKGTGILMVCTFGDATDVTWWREQKLPLRQILGKDGRLVPVIFGSEGWPSADPEAANRCYAQLEGRYVKQARAAIVEMLQREGEAVARGLGAPLQGAPKPIERMVKFYEKGDQPIEFISTRQWFVRLLDKKGALIDQGRRIEWHPAFMRARYENWTEGLLFDWCISRQRYFGVQFPLWYPLDDKGMPDHSHPILADDAQLPVDPTVDIPPGYKASQRDQPGGFTAESDVYDTWFTSSLTPQISSGWTVDAARHHALFPMDIRPQSHEIIRTWAFYTIVKSLLHEGSVPWKHVVVSGWVLDPDRKKMSKSRGNVVTPAHLLDSYTADGVRYWAASARLGTDTAFDEKVLKIGRRLVTKIYNAGKYVLSQTAGRAPIVGELEQAFVERLARATERATAAFEGFDYARALMDVEGFFWSDFTDAFLELVKARARGDAGATDLERGSAVAALRLGLSVLLRLFAPALPFVTEEVWSWAFAAETGHASIHRAPWPGSDDFAGVAPPANTNSFELAKAYLGVVNRSKSEEGASVGRPILSMRLAGNANSLATLRPMVVDLRSAVRARSEDLVVDDALGDGVFRVLELQLESALAPG
jgi:valyl-tRNA synthetase